MSDDARLLLCKGCRDDFYNVGTRRCWSLRSAQEVTRWRLGWWSDALKPGAFVEVKTLSCHHAPGKYAQSEQLPGHAVEPVCLPQEDAR